MKFCAVSVYFSLKFKAVIDSKFLEFYHSQFARVRSKFYQQCTYSKSFSAAVVSVMTSLVSMQFSCSALKAHLRSETGKGAHAR